MAEALGQLNLELAAELDQPLRMGIGLHLGHAIVGEMGHGSAVSLTAIGDTVNVASRLEALTKELGCQLIVSERLARRAGIDLEDFPLHEVDLRGRAGRLAVRLIADAHQLPEPQPDEQPALVAPGAGAARGALGALHVRAWSNPTRAAILRSMSAPARRRMTAAEFLDWAMAQPEGARYELVAGEVVNGPERRPWSGQARGVDALRAAVKQAGLPCEAFIDGMAVRVDDSTVYEPDVLLRCGQPVADDCIEILDPVVVVEVLSPSSRQKDTGGKLDDYLRLPSVRHYLIVETANRTLIHHRRDDTGELRSRILRDATVELRPPGPALTVASLFPPAG